MKKFTRNFCKNLYLYSSRGKSLIFSAYTFLIIYRIFEGYPDNKIKIYYEKLLEKDYLISFKIHFILKYRELYPSVSNKFNELYQGLYFIHVFYNEMFNGGNNNIGIIKDNTINKYIFGKDKFILSFDNIIIDYNIDNLFTKEDNEIFYEVMNKITYFYSIDLNDIKDIYKLIKYSMEEINGIEDNFILNLVEHIYQKNIFSTILQNIKKI